MEPYGLQCDMDVDLGLLQKQMIDTAEAWASAPDDLADDFVTAYNAQAWTLPKWKAWCKPITRKMDPEMRDRLRPKLGAMTAGYRAAVFGVSVESEIPSGGNSLVSTGGTSSHDDITDQDDGESPGNELALSDVAQNELDAGLADDAETARELEAQMALSTILKCLGSLEKPFDSLKSDFGHMHDKVRFLAERWEK